MPARTTRLARRLVPVLVLLGLSSLGGCASTITTTRSPSPADPFEAPNRTAFAFNDAIDRNALRPVAKAYADHAPQWLQSCIGNFFTNLAQPSTALHSLLQAKPGEAGMTLGRFAVNTIFGLGGLFDPASWDDIPLYDEDLGQTLGVWGVPPGPYLMVPLLGPATARDLPSRFADQFTRPLNWGGVADEARWGSFALNLIDTRAGLLPADAALERAYDRYAFVRDAFLQRREYLVRDGNVPEEVFEDPEPELDELEPEPAPDAVRDEDSAVEAAAPPAG